LPIPNFPPYAVKAGLPPFALPPLTDEETILIVRLAALEAVRSGTTAVLEDNIKIGIYAEALADTGLRLLLCERAWDRGNMGLGETDRFVIDDDLGNVCIDRIRDLHAAWHGGAGGRVHVGIAAWAPDICSPAYLRRLTALRHELGCITTIHLNQFWREVTFMDAVHGRKPTQYLADNGFLHDGLICAHCRCMTQGEERILGESAVGVAYNSVIGARRGMPARITDLQSYGCTIGMGSDNFAQDMIEVVRQGLYMERTRLDDGGSPLPQEVMRWATSNGYRLMGIPDGGALTVGNKADLVMVDMMSPHLVPHVRPLDTFVHQANSGDISDVMVNGAWLMRQGVVTVMDEAAIVREAQSASVAAWERFLSTLPADQRPSNWVSSISSSG
jgi:5-methylthioadenosine/S-adenosylhomocysteine deaminase